MVLTPMGLRFAGRMFPCSVGRGGVVAQKREGDGGTPVGIHRIVACLYRPDRTPPPVSWARAIGPGDLWSDDIQDPEYNQMVRAPHGFGHERLARADRQYDLVLVTDWNWPDATPGRGSAIFVHAWRGPGKPTAGCVALDPRHLRWITQRLQPGAPLIIGQSLSEGRGLFE